MVWRRKVSAVRDIILNYFWRDEISIMSL
jgi:hypothetical protein